MVAKTVFILILFLHILPLAAQRDTINLKFGKIQYPSSWDYSAGARFSFLDFEEMNRALDASGLPSLESPVPCVALAVRSSFIWRHWQIESGLELTSGSSKKRSVENHRAVVFRDYALRSRVMYDFLHRKRLTKIFPFAGLGISYQTLNTRLELNGTQQVNPSPIPEFQNRRFVQTPVVCEVGISLERGVTFRKKDIFAGLRGGYAFRFLEYNWVIDDKYAVDLPEPAACSPFVAMMVRIRSAPVRDALPKP